MLTKNNERGFIRELWTEGDKGLKSPINPQESVTDGNFMHGFILHMILEKTHLTSINAVPVSSPPLTS